MEFDQFALVERVLKDVDIILRKESNLSSFEIIPVDTNRQNKSPVLHQGDSLGIESWCIKHLYMTCYSELMDSVPKSKKKNKSTIDCDKLVRLLNVTLLINPDLGTLWNRRRYLVLNGSLDPYFEMRYASIVISRKPKCNDAFAYRRWIWEKLINDSSVIHSELINLVTEELSICTNAAEKSANNYHAWSHRIWLIQKLATSELSQQHLQHIYCAEYGFSEQWSVSHISDHSCFQYRQFCLKNVFQLRDEQWREFEKHTSANLKRSLAKIVVNNMPNDATESEMDILKKSDESLIISLLGKSLKNCNCKPKYSLVCHLLEILFYELNLNNELIAYYKNHETLWYHRRFIIHEILSAIHEYHGINRNNVKAVKNSCSMCHMDFSENKAKIVRYDSDCIFSSLLFLVLISCDRTLIVERKAEGDNYADRHEKYLKFIEGVCL